MDNWRGKWALVTGASAGIGRALAEELAAGGTHLVLTARRQDRLEELAQKLSARGAKMEICVADLADAAAPRAIYQLTKKKGIEIELLVNNAGFGVYGEMHAQAPERLEEMIRLNCGAVVQLTRTFLPEMVARRHGDILIVASTAAFQAVPYYATYAATKAFDLLFAEGVAEEVRPFGVRVCALCPGLTSTEFHAVAGQSAKIRQKQETPEKVARTGLRALAAGKSYVISGMANYLATHGERLVPRRFVTRTAAKMFRPKETQK
jgi:short-subunit dehydrogenase